MILSSIFQYPGFSAGEFKTQVFYPVLLLFTQRSQSSSCIPIRCQVKEVKQPSEFFISARNIFLTKSFWDVLLCFCNNQASEMRIYFWNRRVPSYIIIELSFETNIDQSPFRNLHLDFGMEKIIDTYNPMLMITGLCWLRGNEDKTILLQFKGLCSRYFVTKHKSRLYSGQIEKSLFFQHQRPGRGCYQQTTYRYFETPRLMMIKITHEDSTVISRQGNPSKRVYQHDPLHYNH